MVSDTGRHSQYYRPHTRTVVARKVGIPSDDKWFNNIFIGRGLDGVKKASGYASEGNVFWDGAKKSTFADQRSTVAPFQAKLRREDNALGVTVRFLADQSVLGANEPWVDADLVGTAPTVGQKIEDRHGKPIRVDTDFYANKRSKPAAGPLAELKAGENVMEWSARGR